MGNLELTLWWACQSAADDYRPQALSPEDARRAPAIRSAKALLDWRVSRALLQSVRAAGGAKALSLSHSGGHALCAQAPADRAVGADLERIRPRDLDALAAWVCSAAEQAWLRDAANLPRRQIRFYLLWTLKEAFIKAAGLDFPADMASVGLAPLPRANGRCARRPGGGRRGAGSLATSGWPPPCGAPARPTRPLVCTGGRRRDANCRRCRFWGNGRAARTDRPSGFCPSHLNMYY
ncbi:4-diphosphocytidyl-2C-methyl-D-erythritol kinase [Streptomyces cavourensis]|nr:4-diphosphocytidyl-2C-methyl-D-erythritol kinase [Streptomyces cavourensis]